MRILSLEKLHSGVDYHRLLIPLKYLRLEQGDSLLEINDSQPLIKHFFNNIDIVLFSRESPFNLDQILEFRDELKFKLIVDIDDYWYLYPKHVAYENWKANNTSEQIIKSIRSADLVTTTHKYLQDKIVKLNANVEVLPNSLPYGKLQFNTDKVDANNILYSCSPTHLEDIKSLSRFFELCKQSKDIQEFSFCLAGFNGGNKDSYDTWLKLEKEGKKFGNYKRWGALGLNNYMDHYKYAKIAIAPLEDNEFNRCKSNLKILEAGCKNIPILTSDVHPYTDSPIIKCKTQRDWYNNIKELIRKPELIQEKGIELGNYVREIYNFDKINEQRRKIYNQW